MAALSQGAASLADLMPGQRAKVDRVAADGALGLRLQEMGLIPGTYVRLIRRAPLGGPLQLELRGYQLSLRASDASKVSLHPSTDPVSRTRSSF